MIEQYWDHLRSFASRYYREKTGEQVTIWTNQQNDCTLMWTIQCPYSYVLVTFYGLRSVSWRDVFSSCRQGGSLQRPLYHRKNRQGNTQTIEVLFREVGRETLSTVLQATFMLCTADAIDELIRLGQILMQNGYLECPINGVWKSTEINPVYEQSRKRPHTYLFLLEEVPQQTCLIDGFKW